VVSPEVLEPDEAAVAVVGLGVAVVVEDVAVLEVPPLAVGWMLNWGVTTITGSTVITGAETALDTPVILIPRPWDEA
jgi:hypothetical protein